MTWSQRVKVGLVAGLIGAAGVFAGCGGGDAERGSAAGGADARDVERVPLATAEFSVEGMTCGGCAIATELSVKKLDGVASADASFDEDTGEGRCTVEYDPAAVGPDEIAGAIRDAGFEPTLDAGEAP